MVLVAVSRDNGSRCGSDMGDNGVGRRTLKCISGSGPGPGSTFTRAMTITQGFPPPPPPPPRVIQYSLRSKLNGNNSTLPSPKSVSVSPPPGLQDDFFKKSSMFRGGYGYSHSSVDPSSQPGLIYPGLV